VRKPNLTNLRSSLPYLVIIFYLLVCLIPVYWMVVTSLKPTREVYNIPPTYFPHTLIFENYKTIFEITPFGTYVLNTLIVSASTTITCMFLGIIAAYAIARLRFGLNMLVLYIILATRIIPPISMLVPFFIISRYLHLIGTLYVFIIVNTYMNLPFFIWIMNSFFKTIPKELEEAAKVDGCTRFGVFLKISLPLSRIGIAAASILTFIWTWNEFLFAVVLSSGRASKLLSVGCYDFIADKYTNWNLICAGGVVACIPALIVILFFSSYMIEGMIRGAIKG